MLEAAGLGHIQVEGMGERAPECAGTSPADRNAQLQGEINYKVRG